MPPIFPGETQALNTSIAGEKCELVLMGNTLRGNLPSGSGLLGAWLCSVSSVKATALKLEVSRKFMRDFYSRIGMPRTMFAGQSDALHLFPTFNSMLFVCHPAFCPHRKAAGRVMLRGARPSTHGRVAISTRLITRRSLTLVGISPAWQLAWRRRSKLLRSPCARSR